ncbi:MAG TPA: sulfite exporter TauE/SafE family protein [Balneolaceae bacterium]|nr:sulfite exporter TauE/SafE family protein [Balneolaceae bacterium]
MEWALAGIAFGFLGSFHCIGMCGPLALALPGSNRGTPHLILSRTVYNLGRVITYSTLGLVVGLLSKMISIGGFQQWLSISVGVLILLGLSVSAFRHKLNQWKAYPSKFISKATKPIKTLFQKGTIGSLFLIGLLNGLLPCGFVYMGLVTALTTGTVLKSVFFMAGFGLGTIPAMFAASMASGLISLSLRRRLKKFSPYFMAVVGILLIIRGLNLAIPFLSPGM